MALTKKTTKAKKSKDDVGVGPLYVVKGKGNKPKDVFVLFNPRNVDMTDYPCFWSEKSYEWVSLHEASIYTGTTDHIRDGCEWMTLHQAIELDRIDTVKVARSYSIPQVSVDALADRHVHSTAPDNQGVDGPERYMIRFSDYTGKNPLYWNAAGKCFTDLPHGSLFLTKNKRHLEDAQRAEAKSDWVIAPERGEFFDPDEDQDMDDDDDDDDEYDPDFMIFSAKASAASPQPLFFRESVRRFVPFEEADRYEEGEAQNILTVACMYFADANIVGEAYAHEIVSEPHEWSIPNLADPSDKDSNPILDVSIVKVRAYFALNETMDNITNDLANGLKDFAMANFLWPDESEALADIYHLVNTLRRRTNSRLSTGEWGEIKDPSHPLSM